MLPAKLVFKQRCVPLEQRNGTLRVATCDPFELTAFDELRLLTGMGIELVLADEQDIRKFIRTHYGVAGDTLDELAGDEHGHRRRGRRAATPTTRSSRRRRPRSSSS
jgi:hypothetical protein